MASTEGWTGSRAGSRTRLVAAGTLLLTATFSVCATASLAEDCSHGLTTERVSVAADGTEADGRSELPAVNADGCVVGFKSAATNLIGVSNDRNGHIDVFVSDRHGDGAVITRVPPQPDTGNDLNGISYPPALSPSGNLVAFGSEAANVVRGDFNRSPDVFVYNRTENTTNILSLVIDVNGEGTGGGRAPDLAPAIGGERFVAFTTSADDLVSNDANEVNDVFVRDLSDNSIELISIRGIPGGAPRSANGASAGPGISSNGCVVAFYSDASDVTAGDTNEARDVFVRDRCTNTTTRVSLSSDGIPANGPSQASGSPVAISADGCQVAFASDASNLVEGDTNGVRDVFVRDRCVGPPVTIIVSRLGANANGPSDFPSISADGRFVAFQSAASNLVPGDTNGKSDIFVVDIGNGNARLVSVTDSGAPTNGDSTAPQISAGGVALVYQSDATNLVDGDTNGLSDIFVGVNPLGGTPTPTTVPNTTPTRTPTVTATVRDTPTATPSLSPTETGGTRTASPTRSPTPVLSVTPSVTPTRTLSPTELLRTPTPTPSVRSTTPTTHSPGGGGGGGGCSCRIDQGAEPSVDAGFLFALAAPTLLWGMRRQRRTTRPR